MKNLFTRSEAAVPPRNRHKHYSRPSTTAPSLYTSAYVPKEGHPVSPHISTGKAVTAKERELTRQLQEKNEEIRDIRASYEDRLLRKEHQIQDELHSRTAMQETLKKTNEDRLELSSRFQRSLDNKDWEMEQLQDSNEKLLEAHRSQERNSSIIQRDADAETMDLRERLVIATQELDLCRDDLFRVQPACRISDRDIIEAFETLSEQIINWIDNEISAYERANPGTHSEYPFSDSKDSEVALFLCTYPSAGEYLCRYMVNHILLGSIFGSNMRHLGLSATQFSVLEGIEHGMAALKPPKDAQAVNIWRAESLSALAATQDYTDLRTNHVVDLTRHNFTRLLASFPKLFEPNKAIKRFHDQVMVPAASIVSKLQGLASVYRLDMLSMYFSGCEPLTKEDLKKVTAIDSETGKTLKPGNAVLSNKEGVIGYFILALEPSVVRENEGASGVYLRQETWLVKLDHGRGSRGLNCDC